MRPGTAAVWFVIGLYVGLVGSPHLLLPPDSARFPTPTDRAADPPQVDRSALLGPGSEIVYDAGYTLTTTAAGKQAEKWVSVPMTVVVVGLETRGLKRPCYACCKKGTEHDPCEYFLIPVAGIEEAKILKARPGKLAEIRAEVGIRHEPPKGDR